MEPKDRPRGTSSSSTTKKNNLLRAVADLLHSLQDSENTESPSVAIATTSTSAIAGSSSTARATPCSPATATTSALAIANSSSTARATPSSPATATIPLPATAERFGRLSPSAPSSISASSKSAVARPLANPANRWSQVPTRRQVEIPTQPVLSRAPRLEGSQLQGHRREATLPAPRSALSDRRMIQQTAGRTHRGGKQEKEQRMLGFETRIEYLTFIKEYLPKHLAQIPAASRAPKEHETKVWLEKKAAVLQFKNLLATGQMDLWAPPTLQQQQPLPPLLIQQRVPPSTGRAPNTGNLAVHGSNSHFSSPIFPRSQPSHPTAAHTRPSQGHEPLHRITQGDVGTPLTSEVARPPSPSVTDLQAQIADLQRQLRAKIEAEAKKAGVLLE